MSEQATAIAKREDSGITEYVPFGQSDKIKLSVRIVQNLLCKPTKKGAVCTPNDALKFIAKCQAKRLNPFEDDAFLVGYDDYKTGGASFSQITAHQAFLKRAEASENFDGMESGIIIDNGDGTNTEREGDFFMEPEKVVGGWAKVYLKNRSKPFYRRARLARYMKSTPFWEDDKAGMIVKCAESDALRSAFPTVLGGLYLQQEMERSDNGGINFGEVRAEQPTPMKLAKEAEAKAIETAKDDSDGDLGPQKPAEAPKQTGPVESFKAKLIDSLVEAGVSFDAWRKWGTELDQFEGQDPSSWSGFDEIPEIIAKRHYAARASIIKAIRMNGAKK